MGAPDLKGLSILIVDDEEDFALTLARRLELRGMQVVSAFSGEEGLASMASSMPDLLLLDMRMPGLSGLEVLRKLREEKVLAGGERVPVIIVTGHCSEQDCAGAQELGVQGFHAKPLDFPDLLASIAEATGR